MNKIIKFFLIAGGTLSVVLGVVGMFIPVLPTTPFLLLAAFCYGRSSEKLYQRLVNYRWFGKYIRNYRDGKGIPFREKTLTLFALWVTIGNSVVFIVSDRWFQAALLGIAVGVTVHLLWIKTLEPEVENLELLQDIKAASKQLVEGTRAPHAKARRIAKSKHAK